MAHDASEDGFQALQVVLICGLGLFFILVFESGLDRILDFLRVRAADLHPVLGWRY